MYKETVFSNCQACIYPTPLPHRVVYFMVQSHSLLGHTENFSATLLSE